MSVEELPWEDFHHRSSFFPDFQLVEDKLTSIISSDIVKNPQIPILIHDVLSEGNMGNITKKIPINILVKLGIVENIHIAKNHAPEEVTTFNTLFK